MLLLRSWSPWGFLFLAHWHGATECQGKVLQRGPLPLKQLAGRFDVWNMVVQEAGDESADMAMADRLIEGRGMPQDCPTGMT